ncbi:DUF3047 domain-containing protein [Roseateles koreensis]|uniref:DUF3047 domain-containing protein n=1 Tax=Roseateles koreensis TaxID=2987526 RepID=A0ABT5KRD6_9BURK|nr:DUF3047 domain-containing protein [Roseateles koreensis]MDC8785471.1 DUF3047 domain-containing protein [Roseateles koreensis]
MKLLKFVSSGRARHFVWASSGALLRVLVALGLVGVQAACMTPTRAPAPGRETAPAKHLGVETALADWSARELPGKPATHYSVIERSGRPCVLAQANESASLWRRGMALDAHQIARLQFDWWIGGFAPQASVLEAETDDAPARILLGFSGDESQLSFRNRMQFELARTLTGESPPYALLMYVWDANAAVDTLTISSRSDRIRKIVVGTGPRQAANKGWVRLERDPVADFTRAFGEAPGRLISMALMTDADNTHSQADACYGNILLLDPEGRILPGSLRL